MSENTIHKWFSRLKKESEKAQLSETHLARFEEKLNAAQPKQKGITMMLVYKIAAVFILGIALIPLLKGSDVNTNPEYIKYQETKSYFTAYVEYEVGRHKEDVNPENETVILSALHEVVKLQHDYAQLEKEFIEQNYDKRILKRMIDNFRQQLDILENIDKLLESNKPTTNANENII